VLIAVSGWMNQRQLQVIDYLREENRVMSENQICVRLQGLPLAPQPGVTERYIAKTRLLTLA